MASNDLVKIRGYLKQVLYPKITINKKTPTVKINSDNSFAVAIWEVEEVLEGVINPGEFKLSGEYPSTITYGAPHTILAKEIEHPTYGTQYQLLYMNEEVDFSNLANQKAFLKVFLTDDQIKNFYELYDNPIEVIANHDIDKLMKVHGVGPKISEKIIARFEKYKDYANVYSELNGYGLTPRFINKLINHYSSPEEIIHVVKENPYILIYDIDGIGFKTADRIAMQGGLSPTSPLRISAFIYYFLNEQAEEGNSYVTAKELMINIYDFFGGKDEIEDTVMTADGDEISNVAAAIKELQEKELICVEEKAEDLSSRRVYLTRIYKLEEDIAYHLKRLLKANNKFVYDDWQTRVKQLELKQGFEFDATQLNGIKLGLDEQVCLISGLAGSGKSSLVSGILAALPNAEFAQCALSGKAAARLQEVTGVKGQTIHRLLGWAGYEFEHDEHNPLNYDIIILDEISLVGGEIFLDLLKAIPDGTKLIMLGDLGQLPAIGALNLATDIFYSPVIPTVELKTIHRQAAASGIISTAHEVRNRHQLFDAGFEGKMVLGDLKDMALSIINDRSYTKAQTIDIFKKLYNSSLVDKDIMKIQLISPIRERGDACVYQLNIEAQKICNADNLKGPSLKVGSMDFPYYIHKGDKVMCIHNNYNTIDNCGYESPVFNGWVGMVKDIRECETEDGMEDFVIVDFALGGEIYIPAVLARDILVLGYASTVHKLQGSDAPVVIGAIDFTTPPKMLDNSLIYTLITRAKKYCVLVAQNAALAKAIATNNTMAKRTFLQELLIK